MLPGEHPRTCVLSVGTQGPRAQSWAGHGTRSDGAGAGGKRGPGVLVSCLETLPDLCGEKMKAIHCFLHSETSIQSMAQRPGAPIPSQTASGGGVLTPPCAAEPQTRRTRPAPAPHGSNPEASLFALTSERHTARN